MKKKFIFATMFASLILSSCQVVVPSSDQGSSSIIEPYNHELKYRTYYQILVYSFADSNGDGVGYFKGIYEKSGYLRELGVEGLYLSAIHPAMSYHGYDVTDYYEVRSLYEVDGYTFEDLVTDLKAIDIVVLIDLVLNHSGSNHLWFFQAQDAYGRDEENPYISWYNFSKTQDAKHPWGSTNRYYEGIFSSSMPDFNFDNPDVRREFINIGKFWMEKGIAGFRLDAAMHIFTDYSGGDKWNGDILSKNAEFWTEFQTEIAALYPNFYMVGEVWTAQPKLESYYATNIDSLFNFEHKTRAEGQLFGTASLAVGFQSHQRNIRQRQPDAIEANFLSNHDKPRLSSSLTNQNILKMLGAMTVLAPGNSFIYYGEEVGLKAEGSSSIADRIYRTPMPWGDGYVTNSGLYGNGNNLTSTTVSGLSANAQLADPSSIFIYYQQAIRIKREHFELRAGEVGVVNSGSPVVSVHTMTYEGVTKMVIQNGSSSAYTFNSPVPLGNILDGMSVSWATATRNGNSLTVPAYSSTIVALP